MALATDLTTIRDNLISEVTTETTAWAANGPKPSYSIDGQSVDWNAWLSNRMEMIEKYTAMIAKLTPFMYVNRGY